VASDFCGTKLTVCVVLQLTVQCRIPGFDYVAAGNSTNKKDAQTNAAKDMVQYLVRVGRMPAGEVPEFMPVCINSAVLCTITGDHRSRGQYDNLWSVPRSGQIGPLHKPLNVCKVCVCMGDMLRLLL